MLQLETGDTETCVSVRRLLLQCLRIANSPPVHFSLVFGQIFKGSGLKMFVFSLILRRNFLKCLMCAVGINCGMKTWKPGKCIFLQFFWLISMKLDHTKVFWKCLVIGNITLPSTHENERVLMNDFTFNNFHEC